MRFSLEPLIANLETNPTIDTLHQVLRAPIVGEYVLHYFATDCGERALLRLQAMALPTKDKGFETIRDKRRWLARTVKAEGSSITSAMFVTYLAETGCIGPSVGQTPANVWKPLWAAEGAAGWSRHKENPREIAQQAANLAREAATSLYRADDEYSQQQRDAWCGGELPIADEAAKAAQALEDEVRWQCLRLAWWLAMASLTSRLWLAYEDDCPLPPPDAIALDAGFAQLPKPAPGWTGLLDNADPYLR